MLDDPIKVRVVCNLIEHTLLSLGYRVTIRTNTSITAVSPQKVLGKVMWTAHRGWSVTPSFKLFFEEAMSKSKSLLK